MSTIFGMFTQFICAYDNLQEFDPKYNHRTKNCKKKIQNTKNRLKMVKFKNAY